MKAIIAAIVVVIIAVIVGVSVYFFWNVLTGLQPPEDNFQVAMYDSTSLNSISGAVVTVYDLEQNPISEFIADESGLAYFTLPPGDYFMSAKADGYEEKWFNFSVDESGLQWFDLSLERASSCEEEWSCDAWGACVGSSQSRTCTEVSDCGTAYDKPPESQDCVLKACSNDADCDDGDECTLNTCEGGIMCTKEEITQCKSGDGCCPPTCNSILDTDCGPINGNGAECTRDSECADDGEQCTEEQCYLGSCIHPDKDDGTSCTSGICCDGECVSPECSSNSDCEGASCRENFTCEDPDTCDADCSSDVIDFCRDNDDCCPSGCDNSTDDDCEGNGGCTNECDPALDPPYCDDPSSTNWTCMDCDSDDCYEWCSDDCSDCSCGCGPYTTTGNESDVPGGCSDAYDNDCDSLTNCSDSDCAGDPACAGGCDIDGSLCPPDNCCHECDPTDGWCFTCTSGVIDSQDGNCESNDICSAAPECDEVSVGNLGNPNDYCCTSTCSADNTVGTCTCIGSNCANGYCGNYPTCYYVVSCAISGWGYTLNCSIEDVCETETLTIDKQCSGSGCSAGTAYICQSRIHIECQEIDCGEEGKHYCTSPNLLAWQWYSTANLPEESDAQFNCEDGIDNDCDGATDWDDEDCSGTGSCNSACLTHTGCTAGFCSPRQAALECGSCSARGMCEDIEAGAAYCEELSPHCICSGLEPPPP